MACPLSKAGSQRLFHQVYSEFSKLGDGGREGCSQDIKNVEVSPLMDIANYGLDEEGFAC